MRLIVSVKMTIFVIFVLLIVSASFLYATANYSQQEIRENSALCLDCHDGMDKSLHGTAHELTGDKQLNPAIDVGCISCHDGWEKHIEDPSSGNIEKIAGSSMQTQSMICARCHQSDHQTSMVTTDVHARADLSCLSCHSVHQTDEDSHSYSFDSSELCLSCHPNVNAQFKLRSNHPLESGNIKCIDCHNLSGIQDDMAAVGLDWRCQNCHSEQSGPFVYEHDVTMTHAIQGGGCTECHSPHGSPNERLLNQPKSGTCLQCHGMPVGHATAHSGFVARTDCVVCHSEIHGSNDNRLMLDPNLNAKFVANCFSSSCHGQVD